MACWNLSEISPAIVIFVNLQFPTEITIALFSLLMHNWINTVRPTCQFNKIATHCHLIHLY